MTAVRRYRRGPETCSLVYMEVTGYVREYFSECGRMERQTREWRVSSLDVGRLVFASVHGELIAAGWKVAGTDVRREVTDDGKAEPRPR